MKKSTIYTVLVLLIWSLFFINNVYSQKLQLLKSFGGINDETCIRVGIDGQNNYYLAGVFKGTSYFQDKEISSNTSYRAGFVVKCNSSGNVQWVKKIDASYNATIYGITVANDGTVYITGAYQNDINFGQDINGRNISLTGWAFNNIFVASYNTNGDLLYANTTQGFQVGTTLSYVNSSGELFVTGTFAGDITVGNTTLTSSGSFDIFVAKYDKNCNPVWIKKAGDQGDDRGWAITCDNAGNVFISGLYSYSATFGEGSNQQRINGYGGYDVFVAKYDRDGNFQWARGTGTSSDDEGLGLTTDINGNVYNTGFIGYRLFVSKYNSNGDLQWTKNTGTNSSGGGWDITWNKGYLYSTGYFSGTIDIAGINSITSKGGSNDAYMWKLKDDGSTQNFIDIGSSYEDKGTGIGIDNNGNIIVTGFYQGTINQDNISITSSGGYDIFLAKYSECQANAGQDQVYCGTGTLQLTASGGDTYQWLADNGQRITGQSITVSPSTTTTYTVTVSSGGTCMATDDVVVKVPTGIQVSTGADRTICNGSSATLTAQGATEYEWLTDNGQWSMNGQSITVSPTETTTYTLSATGDCGYTGTSVVVVNVIQMPDLNVSGTTGICKGSGTQLTATGSDTYTWYDPDNGLIYGNQITVNPQTTTTYIITATNSGICYTTQLIPVTVTGADAGQDKTICSGGNLTLSASGGDTYEWLTDNSQRITGQSITVSPSTTTTYTVTATGNGCTTTDDVLVTVNTQGINVQMWSNSTSSCSGGTNITAYATPTTNPVFAWEPVDNPANVSSWNGNGYAYGYYYVTPQQTTTYSVTVTDDNQCSGTNQIVINPLNGLPVTISADKTTTCKGEQVNLNTSGASYYYVNGDYMTGQITVSPNTTTTYTVNGYDYNGCTGSAQIVINVNGADIEALINGVSQYPNKNINICGATEIVLQDRNYQNGNTYEWITDNGQQLTGQSITVNPAITTTYTVTATGNGCTAADQININVTPGITIYPTPDITICPGNNTNIWVNAGNYNYSYTTFAWNTGDNTQNINVTPNQTTTYTVTINDASIGCSATESQVVVVSENITPMIVSDQTICQGMTTSISAWMQGSGTYTYSWNDGNINQWETVYPNQTTTYTVTVSGSPTCSGTAQTVVTISDHLTPNAGTDQTICPGQQANLYAYVQGAMSYQWSNGSTNYYLNETPTATTTYTLTVNGTPTCSGTAQVVVTVNGVNLGPNKNINTCGVASVTLQDQNYLPGNIYQWTIENGQLVTAPSITASPATPTMYSVTSTGYGCTTTDQVYVNVTPAPSSVSLGNDISICKGNSATLTAQFSNWNNQNISWNEGSYNVQSITVSPIETTTYIVTSIEQNGCTATDDIIVTVSGANIEAIIDGQSQGNNKNISICSNKSLTFQDRNYQQGNTYQWSMVNGQLSMTGQSITVSPSESTTYTVTSTGNGCTATDQIIVNVLPVATLYKNADLSVCPGNLYSTNICTGMSNYDNQSFQWLGSDGSQYNSQCINVNPNQATTYTLTMTEPNGCTATTDIIVNVSDVITPNISQDQTICSGMTSSVYAWTQGSGSYTYSWDNGSNSSWNSIAPTQTTTYTVTVSGSPTCSGTAQTVVTISDHLTPNAGTDQTICTGQQANLYAYVQGAMSYQWSNGSTNYYLNETPTATTTYTLTVNGSPTCSGTAQVVVTVDGPNLPANVNLCLGSSTTLDAGDATSYLWSTGESTRQITVTPTTSGQYYYSVQVTSQQCGTVTAGTMVTVNPLSTISAIATSPITGLPANSICSGASVNLTASAGPGSVVNIYEWLTDNGQQLTGQSITVSPTENTIYKVTGTDANGCSSTSSVTVTVNTLPVISAGADQTICSGTTVNLTASAGPGSVVNIYEWLTDNGQRLMGQSITVNPTENIIYIVTGTDNNGCTSTSSVTVSVNPNPVISVTDATICNGNSTTLTTTGATTYTWSTGDNTQTSNISPSVTTTYTVTGTDNNGCSNTSSVTVSVNPLPVISTVDQTICNGNSTTITATGASTYVWSTGDNTQTSNISPSVTTNYTVTGTDNNGCSNTSSVNVTVNPLPVISAGADQTICSGATVNLTATGGYIYIWQTSDLLTGFSILSGLNGSGISANPTTTTTYTVSGTDNNGCSNTSSVNVTVNPLPVISAGADQTICNGSLATLTAQGGAEYEWSTVNGQRIIGQSITVTPNGNTIYTVTGTDANGCTNTTSVIVNVTIVPVNAGEDATICPDNSISFTANGGDSYIWIDGEETALITVQPKETTTYIVTAKLNGCTASDDIIIYVDLACGLTTPHIDFKASTILNTNIFPAVQVMFTNISRNIPDRTIYSWNFGDCFTNTNCTALTAAVGASIDHIYTREGTYQTYLTSILNKEKTLTKKMDYLVKCTNCEGYLTMTVINNRTHESTKFKSNSILNYCGYSPLKDEYNNDKNIIICDGDEITLEYDGYIFIGSGAYSSNYPIWYEGGTVNKVNSNNVDYYEYQVINYSNRYENKISLKNLQLHKNTTFYLRGYTDSPDLKNKSDEDAERNILMQINIIVNPNPVVSISTDKNTVCPGQTGTDLKVNIISSNATHFTYSWYDYGYTTYSRFVEPLTPIVYDVNVTDNNGCTGTASIPINTYVLPTLNAGADQTICFGSDVNLKATGSSIYGGNLIYSWNPSVCSSAACTIPNIQSTTTYKVTVTDINNCSANDQLIVNVTKVNANAGNPMAICKGQIVNLSGSATGGTQPYTYSWSPGSYLSNINIYNPVPYPTANTTYTLTVTDADNCKGTSSTVIYYHDPAVNTGPDQTICKGSSVNLSANFIKITNPSHPSYSWSNNNSSQSITVSPVSTSIYTVTASDWVNSCSATDQVVVNVIQNVQIISDQTIASGNSVTLKTTMGSTNSLYSWSSSPASSQTLSGSAPVVTPSVTTTYYVTMTTPINASNNCVSTASVVIKVIVCGVADAGPDQTICAGSNVTLNGNGVINNGGGNLQYIWSANPSNNQQSVNVSPATTTTYTLTIYNSGCTATDNVVIFVNPSPPVSANSTTTIINNNSPSAITLTGSGAKTYKWDNGITDNVSFLSPVTTTTYSVTGTDINKCTNTASIIIIVSESVPNCQSNTCICNGSSYYLPINDIYQTGNYVKISANPDDKSLPKGCLNNSQHALVVNVKPTLSTTYTVTFYSSNNCGGNPISKPYIFVVNVSNPVTANAGSNQTICKGNSTTLNATGGISYLWDNGENTSSIIVKPNVTTTYNVTVYNYGCSAQSSVVVTVGPNYNFNNGTQNQSICKGNNASISISGDKTNSYTWSNGVITSPPYSPPNSSYSSITVSPLITTTYNVTISNGNSCTVSENAVINVSNPPTPIISGDITTCNSSSLTYTIANNSVYNSNYTYSWSITPGTYNNPAPNLSNSSITVNWKSNLSSATVNLTITNKNNLHCSASTSIEINKCCNLPYVTDNNKINPNKNVNKTYGNQTGNKTDVEIDGMVNVNSDLSFVNCNLHFGPNAGFNISNFKNLSISNCYLTNIPTCSSEFWTGIISNKSSNLTINSPSTLENAKNAVVINNYNPNSSIISISGLSNNNLNTFQNNNKNIIINNSITSSEILNVSYCKFISNLNPTKTSSGIEVNNSNNIKINNCSFTKMFQGITAVNSQLNIIQNSFDQISDPYKMVDPAAIYATTNPAVKVNFIPTLNVGSNNSLDANTVTNSKIGVYSDGYQNNIIYNNINAIDKGIWSNNILTNSNFLNNTITAANSIINYGILLQNIIVNNAGIKMNLSTNTIINAYKGISVWNIKGSTELVPLGYPTVYNANIYNNIIKYTINPKQTCYGIDVKDCNTLEVTRSHVSGANAGNNVTGISSDNSKNINIHDNTNLSQLAFGLMISGLQTSSNYSCNQISNSLGGFNFGINTTLSQQGSPGLMQNGQYIVKPHNATNFFTNNVYDFVATGNIINKYPIIWYLSSGNIPKCDQNSNPSNKPNFIFTNQSSMYNNCNFKSLDNEATENAADSREKKYGKIVRNETNYTSLNDEIKYHENSFVYNILKYDSALMNLGTDDDHLYKDFYNQYKNTSIGLFSDIDDNIWKREYKKANKKNKHISPEMLIEYNLQTTTDIYLETFAAGNYDLTKDQIKALEQIAYMDPVVGGDAVFTARIMLRIDPDLNKNNDYNINNKFLNIDRIIDTINSQVGRIHPNPSNGDMYLDYKLTERDYGEIDIYNIFGEKITSYELKHGQNTLVIENDILNNGIYFYKIYINNKAVIKDKLIHFKN